MEIVKLINRLVNSTSVEDSLEDYEEMTCENETLSLQVKDEMRQKLGQLVIFEDVTESSINGLVCSTMDQKEKGIIDEFVGLFTSRSNLKEEEKNYENCRCLILEEMRWTTYFLNKLKTSLYTEISLGNYKFRQLASIIKYIFALIV